MTLIESRILLVVMRVIGTRGLISRDNEWPLRNQTAWAMADISDESSGRGGFTLIEVVIVLVIIGLIMGGVLLEQDLIKDAQRRATSSQDDDD